MREFGEIRARFSGDTEAAQGYLGYARVLLGVVDKQRIMGGLGQLSRTFTLPDGTVIIARSVQGQLTVDITTAPTITGSQETALTTVTQATHESIEDTTPDTVIPHFKGLVVVGEWDDADANGHSFIWTKHTGLVEIPYLPGCYYGGATGISSDGMVVVGTCGGDVGDYAYRWTKKSGTVSLGPLGGDQNSVGATSVSGSGKDIYGNGFDPSFAGGSSIEWKWDATTGYIDYPSSNGSFQLFGLPNVSRSGKYVVGIINDEAENKGVLWRNGARRDIPLLGTSNGPYTATWPVTRVDYVLTTVYPDGSGDHSFTVNSTSGDPIYPNQGKTHVVVTDSTGAVTDDYITGSGVFSPGYPIISAVPTTTNGTAAYPTGGYYDTFTLTTKLATWVIPDQSIPGGVSNNGVVAGGVTNQGMFVWDSVKGSFITVGTGATFARGISADGHTAVGKWVDDAGLHAFFWTVKTGPVILGQGQAYAVSDDGATIVGGVGGTEAMQPAIWNKKGNLVTIVTPAGSVNAWATAIATPQL
jgi:hypothetical protein